MPRALALVLIAAASQAAAAGTEPVHLTAERLVREPDGSVLAEGHVRLEDGPIQIAGERITYDPATEIARSDEPITAVDGAYWLRARSFVLHAGERTGTFQDVQMVQKREVIPPEVAFTTPDLQRPGRNQLVLHAERVERRADGSLKTTAPTFTLCDCGDGEQPSWRFAATTATVTPGESVSMIFPRLEFPRLPLPPLPLPYLSLPLSHRKTGLLPPLIGLSPSRGVEYEQPLYFVLGRSADATFSAGYFSGALNSNATTTFRGPRTSFELRYAPRQSSFGRFFLQYARDLNYFNPAAQEAGASGNGPKPVLNRWAYQLEEQDDWGYGLSDHANVALVTDRNYISDFTDDPRLRGQQVLRSTAWVAERRGSFLSALSVLYNQDLRPAPPVGAVTPLIPPALPGQDPYSPTQHEVLNDQPQLFGPHSTRTTFEYMPVLSLDLAHLALGPAVASVEAQLARIAPLGHKFSDTGTDGLFVGDTGWSNKDCGEQNGVLDARPGGACPIPAAVRGGSPLAGGIGELAAATRLSLRPLLAAPLLLPPWVSFRPYAGYRENAYFYDLLDTGGAGWGFFGAAAQTEIARVFRDAGVRNAFIPRIDVRRLIPGPGLGAPPRPYDEIDLGPSRAETQGEVSLGTRLDRLDGTPLLDAALGQDALLAPELRAIESFATANLTLGPLGSTGLVRWNPLSGRLTEVAASGRLASNRGDQLRVSYIGLGTGGSARLRAGPDELFSTGPALTELGGLSQLSGGLTFVPARGLSFHYDIVVLLTRAQALNILFDPNDDQIVGVLSQTLGLSYVSPCGCWGGSFALYHYRGQPWWPPGLTFSLDLGGLMRL